MIDKSTIYGEKKEIEFPVKKYVCNHCDTIFFTDKKCKVNTCILCENHDLVKEDYNEIKKFSVIPFVKNRQDVVKDYKKKVLRNPLVPFSFRKKKNYQVIRKAFLPAFLVNVDHSGKVIFLEGDKQLTEQNHKKEILLKKFEVSHLIHFDYKDVLLNVSTKIDNKLFVNICDYDCDSLQKLDSSLIQDTVYLLEDVEAAEIGKKERERISNCSLLEVRNQIPHDLKKLKKDDSVVSFYDAQEILLPVYLIHIKYKDKIYQYIMNGQNGKSYIHLPIGIFEGFLFVLLLGGIIFLIVYLLVYYF